MRSHLGTVNNTSASFRLVVGFVLLVSRAGVMIQELHRDFIAAVFDMGLKKADPSRLKGILPKKDK